MTSDRRTFLKHTALGAAATAVPGVVHAELAAAAPSKLVPTTPVEPAQPVLDGTLLQALGEAVLPESLGAHGQRLAVAAFAAWLAAYRPVAEEMHGYGQAEITYTPSDPAPGWQSQLQGLELLAQRSQSSGFAALDVAARRSVLKAPLARIGDARVPLNPAAAQHVAIALLAHWTASSAAQDLAYQARIGANTCRGLGDTARPPLPLDDQPTQAPSA